MSKAAEMVMTLLDHWQLSTEDQAALLGIASSNRAAGENVVIFNLDVLSNPRFNCQLTYRLEGDQIVIEKQPGVAWFTVAVANLY